jgi:hypothetical protein
MPLSFQNKVSFGKNWTSPFLSRFTATIKCCFRYRFEVVAQVSALAAVLLHQVEICFDSLGELPDLPMCTSEFSEALQVFGDIEVVTACRCCDRRPLPH